jgi:hypothetical protein
VGVALHQHNLVARPAANVAKNDIGRAERARGSSAALKPVPRRARDFPPARGEDQEAQMLRPDSGIECRREPIAKAPNDLLAQLANQRVSVADSA